MPPAMMNVQSSSSSPLTSNCDSGEYLSFTYDLSEKFRKPGIYKVTWKCEGFRSPEIVFRVMPKKAVCGPSLM